MGRAVHRQQPSDATGAVTMHDAQPGRASLGRSHRPVTPVAHRAAVRHRRGAPGIGRCAQRGGTGSAHCLLRTRTGGT
ncbi:hypothetical protein KR76_00098 [Pimelobacter simplex]|uniref:Uncharacterized protein n=1 Tax=Nocardioides simplex TaxID=2045 RepID=A0A0C5XH26_NOCSI|nr:hypothetical protein KR76_00098 [Pimelobacter simplex]